MAYLLRLPPIDYCIFLVLLLVEVYFYYERV
jgi:hypothetical protein